MVSLLPAILVGGPPNAGKSVLTYNLTQTLRQRKVSHYVLRANPDGEGDWFHEACGETVRQIHVKGNWTDSFIQLVCRDLERRPLPLLVDLGGLPTEKEGCVFKTCTHSLLLLHADNEVSAQHWRHLVATHGLLPLAELCSERSGASTVTSHEPVIKGTISGLERGATIHGPVFDALVERISALFGSYTPNELEKIHLDAAPTELVVNLAPLLQTLAPGSQSWTPEILSRLLAELPFGKALAVYGRGPIWLYGLLALQTGTEPFYQFDARLGWVMPPVLSVGTSTSSVLQIDSHGQDGVNVLTTRPVNDYLDYTEAGQLRFPPIPTDEGVILNGKIPFWLVTALVRLYTEMGVAWIACHQPQLRGAVVIASHKAEYAIGGIVALPL